MHSTKAELNILGDHAESKKNTAEQEAQESISLVIPEWEGEIPFRIANKFPKGKIEKIKKALTQKVETEREAGRFSKVTGDVNGFNIEVTVDGETLELNFVSGRPKILLDDTITGSSYKSGIEKEQATTSHEEGHSIFNKILSEFKTPDQRKLFVQNVISQLKKIGKWNNLALGILKQYQLISLGLPANNETALLEEELQKSIETSILDIEKFFIKVASNLGTGTLENFQEVIVNEIYANATKNGDKFIIEQLDTARKNTELNNDEMLPIPVEDL